jgi:hypothetical protein
MVNPMNDGSTSFYHNSVGGYHAAKPRRYQELFDFQIAKNNLEVLHMLNTKYFIFPGENNQEMVQINEEANGNAWFVEELKWVESANEEIRALDSLDTKQTAVIDRKFEKVLKNSQYGRDSTASIELVSYKANELEYRSSAVQDQFAVFSEMYYKNGWNAYIDGVPVDHIRVNYVLRAMEVPKGEHSILFKFEPEVIRQGSTISLISYALFILIPLGWYARERKKDEKGNSKEKI